MKQPFGTVSLGYSADQPIRGEYARLAPEYDIKWSFYVEATIRRTLAHLAVRPGSRVLDVGCGTGTLLCQLSRTCPQAQLAGVDPVPEMLAVARRKLPAAVELREGCAECLPFNDESFDAVVTCNVLHFIRQPLTGVREMRRVLRSGGQLVITDWCNDYFTSRLRDRYLRLRSAAHCKAYRTREVLQMLEEAGCARASITRYKINWLWGLMTARATKPAAVD